MDDQFLKTIIDSVSGQLSAERIENFKIRREAQLRRLMSWYNVNRERAQEIQAEMGYPFIRISNIVWGEIPTLLYTIFSFLQQK